MFNQLIKKNILFFIFLTVAYVWGVVSFQHYLPAGTDFFLSLYSATILSVGLFFNFIVTNKNKTQTNTISVTTIAWLLFLIIFLVQPILNPIAYIDDHLLSVATILLCVLLSYTITNLSDNEKNIAVNFMAVGILVAGLFTVLAQVVQAIGWNKLDGILFMRTSTRLFGNIAQPNQAAYVLVMAWAAFIYLCIEYKNKVYQHKILFLGLANIITFLLTLGLGLSASRGGIVLMACAILGTVVIYYQPIKIRMIIALAFLPSAVMGYILGTDLLQSFTFNELKPAVDRLVGEGESLGLRKSLLNQAWLAFQSSPITGIGWDNLKYFGMTQAEQLAWFTVANHAHNLPAQIAAELGILGLIPLCIFFAIIIKNFGFKLPHYKAFVYIILGLTFAYSLSEYPLWYFRFLLLAVFFVTVIDTSRIRLNIDFSKISVGIALLFVLGGSYYIHHYYRYVDVAYAIKSDLTDYEQEILAYQDLPNVFGYTKYKEGILYMLSPIDEQNLELQIQLGDRVLSHYLDSFIMLKQADLLVLAGRHQEAERLFKAACSFQDYHKRGVGCKEIIQNLKETSETDTRYLIHVETLQHWFNQRFKQSEHSVK